MSKKKITQNLKNAHNATPLPRSSATAAGSGAAAATGAGAGAALSMICTYFAGMSPVLPPSSADHQSA